jgi:hypothetical protein
MPEKRPDRETARLLVDGMRDKHLEALHRMLNQVMRLDLDERAVEARDRTTEAVEHLDEALRQFRRRLEEDQAAGP